MQKICVFGLIFIAFASTSRALPPISPSPFWASDEEGKNSTGMVWRDCNNDGYIDVFYSNGNDIVLAENTVYLSRHGVMPTAPSWSSGNLEYSGHCSVGDINDDGWPDFAVANYLGSGGFSTANLSNLYLNNDGELSVLPDWYTGDSIYTFSCAFGDADGDGDLDLAFATGDGYYNKSIPDRIYFNTNGTLQTTPGWQSASGTQALDVAWGDIDNDGDLDLAFCYDDRSPALYYNNGGAIETTPTWSALHNESANTIIFGDVNTDGWLDLIVAFNSQLGGQGRYRVYYNNGAGTLNADYGWQSSTGGYGSAIALYDYDHDGDDDLAAGRWFDQPRIYENTGTSFTTTPVWRAEFETVVEEMAWVDIDRNGVEQRTDTIVADGAKKVFYTRLHPLYSLDSVRVDGVLLGLAGFCFDPFYGWVSLAIAPTSSVILYYQYSFTNDLTTSNWDTDNYAYANTSLPPVVFTADTTIGHAPLTVNFSDYSLNASAWLWHFGDGDTSAIAAPEHTYTEAGLYDVRLDNTLTDGPHNHTELDMIIALGDTLYFADTTYEAGQDIVVPVYLKNAFALDEFTLALSYAGPLNLQYSGYSTTGCRTDYFPNVSLSAISGTTRQLVLRFIAGSTPLAPGNGPIVKITFSPVYTQNTATLDSTTLNENSTSCISDFFSYRPFVRTGQVSTMLCGNANGDGIISIGDAVFLINYIFREGPPPLPLSSGDANCDGAVNVGDAVYIISYILRGGSAPCCP